jgi:transposase
MARPSKYPPEFREQAVEMVRASGKTVAEVARDLQFNDTTLGNWVRAPRPSMRSPTRMGLAADGGGAR